MKEATDRPAFAQLMAQAALVFAETRPLTKPLLGTYWDVLHPYSLPDLSEAFDALYKSRTFRGLPTPAEIRNAVHITPPEPDRPAPLTFAELEGTSAKFRFCRYLMLTEKWRELGDDPEGRKWRGAYEAWETAGQPMPNAAQRKSMLKGMA